jgi:hypothetical protein
LEVHTVVASIAAIAACSVAAVCVDAIMSAAGTPKLTQHALRQLHELMLLAQAFTVQAAHQKQRGRTQLPEVSAAVAAAM